MITFTVDIAPMGAVRMTQRSKWEDPTAQRYLSYKRLIGYEARKHIQEPITTPIHAELHFYHPIPQSWAKKKQQQAREGDLSPITKPDIDNCVKGVFDALNKIAWKDDNQVVSLTTFKHYSDEPRIEIKVKEVIAA
ncbi:RusA family crossover junction endodeoxyribonuclease [Paenibacillus sp. Marseille-Q4541]|uniref:RusA family crossover junction endodeoxyribonuclease n=1 Tax=Paenibacillus sp. Marseille-Q4541 TaxID=2831522 RepID=UPI001BA526BD|nr:RusA family crossover junction endodeoxyribonuclease [Paenibacillus sp. Marseille-Q4541]